MVAIEPASVRGRWSAALLGFSALIVLIPVLSLATIALSPVSDTEPKNIWLGIWALGALGLTVTNLIASVVLFNKPRPVVIRRLWLLSGIVIVSCPIIWMFIAK